ncbi:MAG: glycosyltransferase family 4 protein [Firmicutes bacterium]|nr:glycosyltransferase family 4 protein [Bacillota bacterium]
MRVLLTTILVRSGLLTHVLDLARHLAAREARVSLAIPETGNLDNDPTLLGPVAGLPVYVYRGAADLVSFASEQGVELVHAHSPRTFETSAEASRRLGVPLVLTLHSVRDWWGMYRGPVALAARLIAVGPGQAQSAGPYVARKVVLIQNGVDLERFHPTDLEQGREGPLHVLWFGRYDPPNARGARALDTAVSLLRGEGRVIEGRRVGLAVGSPATVLEDYGWTDDPVPHLQWGHVAFGHSRSLREAMACGNVGFLLAYGYAGLESSEWFVNETYTMDAFRHYAFPEPDPRVIARDLARLDDDRELLVTLRRRARAIAETFFDVRVMASRTLGLYRSVLAGRPTPPAVVDPSPAQAGRRGGGGLLKVVVRD